ncbi:MAG: dienelactone hydrolase family protein [Deltaproteobacteria bacterium]|nr:dienelactone hydrolase family protein [Deltaproteobacteria bacterium]MBW2415451.1 dienelactone hydrolase family protein [Deltaproteobacteria bacterium]
MQTSVETLEIEAPGGEMPAFLCLPATTRPPRAGVLVLMDAFGLSDHVRGVARRLSGAGYVALAPDLYYREGGGAIPYGEPDRATDRVMRTIALSDAPEERTKDERILGDLRAALEALRADDRVDGSRLGALGLAMGGRLAFLLACREPGALRAAVSFYGPRIVPIVEESRSLETPLLLLFGEKDPGISRPQVDRIRAELEHREKEHEIEIYPGASTGFLCEERTTFRAEAASAAWDRSLGFLGRHLAE